MNEKVVVSIRCFTYNHEPYIRQCLEGFVMQKTNFRFEAIVHDDASTDGTAAIIREYAEKYPDIIKPIYETENQYSKHDGSLKRIMDAHMRGKYIAICEGDDYWTDPYKLQKQVDFLEENDDYSMCFTSAKVSADGVQLSTNLYQDLQTREYSGSEIIARWIVPTCSVVYRWQMINYMPQDKRFWCGDNVMFLTCAKYGRVYCIAENMSTYRRTENGAVYKNMGYEGSVRQLNHNLALLFYFPEFKDGISDAIIDNYVRLFFNRLKKFKLDGLKFFIKGISFGGLRYIKWMLKCIKVRFFQV